MKVVAVASRSEVLEVQQPAKQQSDEPSRNRKWPTGKSSPHLNRGAWPLLLANDKKPLCGEKSMQLVR